MVGVTLLAGITNLRADIVNLQLKNSQVNQPFASVRHLAGGTVGYDAICDATRIHPDQPNKIDIYSQIPGSDLQLNCLPAADVSSVTNIVNGLSLVAPVNVSFQTSIIVENGEFNGKILNLDIYVISNGIPILKGTYDARSTTNGNPVALTITNGHSYDIVFRPEIANTPPISANSTASGAKDAALSGWFAASDSDGVVTNVYALSSPSGFTVNGTNWTYAPQGFKGTNTVSFYAVDNMGAASTTNSLTLITTNNPNLNAAVITNFALVSGTVTLNALASPGYEHVLLSSTDLTGFGPVATNVIPYLGTNDMTSTSFSLPAASEASFYKLNSR